MFWFAYLMASLLVGLILAGAYKKYFFELFIFIFIILITPAQIEISVSEYAPSLFTFLFNIVFLQDPSIRVLKPLFLSIPLTLFILSLYVLLKRKFF